MTPRERALIDRELEKLTSQVTALTMLLEALYVDQLSRDENPTRIADEMISSLREAERAASREDGTIPNHVMRISHEITSLLDRATRRAMLRNEGKDSDGA